MRERVYFQNFPLSSHFANFHQTFFTIPVFEPYFFRYLNCLSFGSIKQNNYGNLFHKKQFLLTFYHILELKQSCNIVKCCVMTNAGFRTIWLVLHDNNWECKHFKVRLQLTILHPCVFQEPSGIKNWHLKRNILQYQFSVHSQYQKNFNSPTFDSAMSCWHLNCYLSQVSYYWCQTSLITPEETVPCGLCERKHSEESSATQTLL